MKRNVIIFFMTIALATMMSSCYSHKFVIGDGPKTGVTVSKKNSFLLYGLIPMKVSDPQKMAGGAKDFQVTEVITFTDGLLSVITFGIYTPSTTRVQK